jgi:hypothetical protein
VDDVASLLLPAVSSARQSCGLPIGWKFPGDGFSTLQQVRKKRAVLVSMD